MSGIKTFIHSLIHSLKPSFIYSNNNKTWVDYMWSGLPTYLGRADVSYGCNTSRNTVAPPPLPFALTRRYAIMFWADEWPRRFKRGLGNQILVRLMVPGRSGGWGLEFPRLGGMRVRREDRGAQRKTSIRERSAAVVRKSCSVSAVCN